MTTAVDDEVSSNFFSSDAACSSLVELLLFPTLTDPDAFTPQPLALKLAPVVVAIDVAMLLPAVSEILRNEEALDVLDVCQTFVSKLAAGPVLAQRTGNEKF